MAVHSKPGIYGSGRKVENHLSEPTKDPVKGNAEPGLNHFKS